MPPCGTFDYIAVVPDNFPNHSTVWNVRLCNPIKLTGDKLSDYRLVGHSPIIEVSDGGIIPDPPLFKDGIGYPKVLRSKITLTATERELAQVSSTYFYVDKNLINAFQPGDVIHIVRTLSAELGLSVIRDGQLVVAVGAVTSIPLGNNITAQLPLELIAKAEAEVEAVFRSSDRSFRFRFHKLPIEFCFRDKKRILFQDDEEVEGYKIHVARPAPSREDFQRPSECVAICLKGACQIMAANLSAEMFTFDNYNFKTVSFPDHNNKNY